MRSAKLITRLDRYIFRQLLLALIAVTGGLTALVWLIQSLRFVELVVNHGLSLIVFAQLPSRGDARIAPEDRSARGDPLPRG